MARLKTKTKIYKRGSNRSFHAENIGSIKVFRRQKKRSRREVVYVCVVDTD